MLKFLQGLLKKDLWQNVLLVMGTLLALYFFKYYAEVLGGSLYYIYLTFPIWLPIILLTIFFELWFRYIRTVYIKKQGSVLLEIKLPKEIFKSPLAMEIILTALYQAGNPKNYFETYWDGKVPPWFSLEMISEEGKIRFFIWTHKKFRNMVEAQIYAQYPGVEVMEVPDYTTWLPHDPENFPTWATTYRKKRPSPYPIKTYVDFGLDKDPKEEFKIDPLTSTLELLGSMRKGEWIWIQILIQAHRKESIEHGRLFTKEKWDSEIKSEIKKIVSDSKKKIEADDSSSSAVRLTDFEKEAITSLEKGLSKYPFDTGIRAYYISTKEAFNSIGISGIIGAFRQYSSNYPYQNEIGIKWFTDFDHWYQDWRRIKRNKIEKEMLDAYRKRSFFQHPYKHFHVAPFVMTTEELATIYHFPGGVAATPSFERIPSKKAEPPANLPV